MKYDIEKKKYYKYVRDVLDGEVVACEYIKSACRRFLKYLERDDVFFDIERVDRCMEFISTFRHYTGSHNGKRFILEPWQQLIVASVIGLYYKGTNTRVINFLYIEMARKQGKSFLIAALSMWFLCCDGEASAEVDVAANSRAQARILGDMCKTLAKQFDGKGKYIKTYRNSISFPKTNSVLNVMSSDTTTLDGYNASLVVSDECHAWRDTKLFDVLRSSQGMRSNPLTICITSAGLDLNSPCYGLRKTGIQILKGELEDEHSLYYIYTQDDDDNPLEDETVWKKSNPNLGVTVRKEWLRAQLDQAMNDTTLLVGVLTKNLNIWCSSATNTWLSHDVIVKSMRPVDYDFFRGKRVFVGVDLSSVSDFSCVSYMTVDDDGNLYFKNEYFCPEDTLNTKSTYIQWTKLGAMIPTEGNVIDYRYITQRIRDFEDNILEDDGFIEAVGYDSWNAVQWAIEMETDAGFSGRLVPVSQSVGNYNRPTKEFERRIKSGHAFIDNNPINAFCLENAVLKIDPATQNSKPIKKNKTSESKIDGCIGCLTALAVYLNSPQYSAEAFVI